MSGNCFAHTYIFTEEGDTPPEFKDLITQAWHNDPTIRPAFLVPHASPPFPTISFCWSTVSYLAPNLGRAVKINRK